MQQIHDNFHLHCSHTDEYRDIYDGCVIIAMYCHNNYELKCVI